MPNWPSNWFGRLRSMSAAASVADAGSVALNGSVSQSRTGSGPLAARAARNVRLAQAVDAREPDRIELAHEIREVLLALRGRGLRHRVVAAPSAAGTTRGPAALRRAPSAGFSPTALSARLFA